MLNNSMSLLIFVFKSMSFRNTSRVSNSMDQDNARHFSLIWVQVVDKVYQRKSFSRQLFDVVGK